jgi:enoyl-CoA hydratase/carnithine racemase
MARRCWAWRSNLIEISRQERIIHIALNRPEKRNALNLEMCTSLVEAINNADHDHSVGVIVLSGNGPSFCAGMDLKESLDADQLQLAGIHEQLFSTLNRIRTPIIAAVQGAALAGGTGLVANTHIVVAHPDAHFGLTEVKIGLWPVFIFRAITQAMGERRAVELSLTARPFSAEEAREYGLVTEISTDPLARAIEIATAIAAFSPVAIGVGLDYVHKIRGRDWQHAGTVGRATRDQLLTNDDYREGVAAFMEKRKPRWPSLVDIE